MKQYLALMALVVKEYDEAIDFFTQKLNFQLIEDTPLTATKRWVRIAPPGSSETCLLLARAKNEEETKSIGNQTGGRVFLFLFTDNHDRDYQNLLDHNITIVRETVEETYGKVAVFADLYGNLWDLIEPSSKNSLANS